MPKCWEFTQKNIFSELLSLMGRITQENLTCQIEYRSHKTTGQIKCQSKLGGIIRHYYRD